MRSRTGLIVLAGLGSLAGLALSPSAVNAQTSESANGPAVLGGSGSQATRSTGGVVFSDLLISSISIRGGRTVATTRTDRQGGFRFELPAGEHNICLNGPGLRSAIDRGGGGGGEQRTLVELLVVIAIVDGSSRNQHPLTFPAVGASGRGPARDLCFPYTVNAGPGPADEVVTRRTNQPTITLDVDNLSQAPADGGRAGGVRVAVGDVNGDGRADRQVDPRIPPPGSQAAPARPAAPQTVAVAGTVSLVR